MGCTVGEKGLSKWAEVRELVKLVVNVPAKLIVTSDRIELGKGDLVFAC